MNQSKTILIYRLRLKLTDLLECIKIHMYIDISNRRVDQFVDSEKSFC